MLMRTRRRSKAAAQRRHARRRFGERHFLDVSNRGLDEMVRAIQAGRATFVRRTSLRCTVFDVEFQGKRRRVVYDKQRKTIVTTLPIPPAETATVRLVDQGSWGAE